MQPKIPFSKIVCDGNELKYLTEVLKSGWLTTASKALEFEKRFAEMTGVRYACAVNSCTSALHLAAEAIGINPGDKVLVPTMTFTATAEVIRYMGADPVFHDVDYGTCLLTPDILDGALNRHPDVKAVMVVHYGGQAAEMGGEEDGKGEYPVSNIQHPISSTTIPSLSTAEIGGKALRRSIMGICRERGVKVIEDAAHAFPTRHDGRMLGGFGEATCFSFYANKTITTGEGGMLTTNDEAIWRRVKVMRLHGIDRDIWNRFTSDKPSWEYDVVAPGFKYNMPDLNAAIGLAQLERAEEFRSERQRCAEYYLKNLAGIEHIDLPSIRGDFKDHSWHLFGIVIKDGSPIDRNRFIESMAARGIGTSVHYKPIHRMTYYREKYQLNPQDYPNAERRWRGCVSLPIYPFLRTDELEHIVATIRHLVGG